MDFIAIGDTVVDDFIKLKEAQVTCDVHGTNADGSAHDEGCHLSMAWGVKIPYESSTVIAGVGNAANAAVSAARLGLSTGYISNIGRDRDGEAILANFKKERVDARYVAVSDTLPTNHHYVLMYEAERTILIRHEAYHYTIPTDLIAPKWMYLSSLAEHTEAFHQELATWLTAHPETRLAFQPGTFQIRMGKEVLKDLYAQTQVVAVNKEEAEQILGVGPTAMKTLLAKMHELGPKIVLITDGPNGASVSDGNMMLSVPMYPDPAPPVSRTGAGDATTSTFVVALALGKSIEEALRWGPINSMSVVQQVGAQAGLLTRPALEQYLATAPADYQATPL